jgi:hypothetical protein
VLNGVAAGRRALSGDPPMPLPGVTPIAAPARYQIDGVPSGTIRLRVTKQGYVDQEREVTGAQFTGADFYLQRH